MNDLINYEQNIFENIKHIDEEGNEYWLARELQKALEYSDWRNFNKVIDKAFASAKNSYPNQNVWGVEVNISISSGKGKIEIAKDYKLTRYACYLIVQNGDSKKSIKELETKDIFLVYSE